MISNKAFYNLGKNDCALKLFGTSNLLC